MNTFTHRVRRGGPPAPPVRRSRITGRWSAEYDLTPSGVTRRTVQKWTSR